MYLPGLSYSTIWDVFICQCTWQLRWEQQTSLLIKLQTSGKGHAFQARGTQVESKLRKYEVCHKAAGNLTEPKKVVPVHDSHRARAHTHTHTTISRLTRVECSGGTRGRRQRMPPYGPRFFRFDIQIFRNVAASRVGAPPLRGRCPPHGKSWIRYWNVIIVADQIFNLRE